MSWLKKLKYGLQKTSSKISDGIVSIFIKKKLTNETLEELQDLLISADLGIFVSKEIVEKLSKDRFDKEIDHNEIKKILADDIYYKLQNKSSKLEVDKSLKPQVILVCGVNGNGKTTTIGKLAAKYQSDGHKIMIAACDTFRAAAVSQLKIWADRAKCLIYVGEENEDPASVAYKALNQAKKENCDLLFIDTAGRLQNKTNLMEELTKIKKVLKKIDESAPHHTILVLDATTGQNAHVQLEAFSKSVDITGLIITKLDGTAKAGVLVSLVNKFKIKIYAIGVGESVDDLNEFDPREYARSLVGIES